MQSSCEIIDTPPSSQVFDVPSKGDLPFEDRMAFLKSLFGPSGSYACPEVHLVEQTQAEGRDHVLKMLKDIESEGGEGLMLRKPESEYQGRRSNTLLKLKVGGLVLFESPAGVWNLM